MNPFEAMQQAKAKELMDQSLVAFVRHQRRLLEQTRFRFRVTCWMIGIFLVVVMAVATGIFGIMGGAE